MEMYAVWALWIFSIFLTLASIDSICNNNQNKETLKNKYTQFFMTALCISTLVGIL